MDQSVKVEAKDISGTWDRTVTTVTVVHSLEGMPHDRAVAIFTDASKTAGPELENIIKAPKVVTVRTTSVRQTRRTL